MTAGAGKQKQKSHPKVVDVCRLIGRDRLQTTAHVGEQGTARAPLPSKEGRAQELRVDGELRQW